MRCLFAFIQDHFVKLLASYFPLVSRNADLISKTWYEKIMMLLYFQRRHNERDKWDWLHSGIGLKRRSPYYLFDNANWRWFPTRTRAKVFKISIPPEKLEKFCNDHCMDSLWENLISQFSDGRIYFSFLHNQIIITLRHYITLLSGPVIDWLWICLWVAFKSHTLSFYSTNQLILYRHHWSNCERQQNFFMLL